MKAAGLLILLAFALGSVLMPTAAVADDYKEAPVYFDFNPQDVAKYDAVVITVCGLDFHYLPKSLFDSIFRQGEKDASAAAAEANLLGAVAPDQDELLTSAAQNAKLPHTYVEDAVNAMLATAGKHYMVVPLRWNRIVAQTTAAEANLENWLPQVSAAAQANHKPLYIFAHSWGTILTRHVLMTLAAKGSPVHVDKYITVGSPMVPANPVIEEFDRLQLPNAKDEYGDSIRKPANVASWTNFWAKHDVFSNVIPAADLNYRVDDDADRYQELLHAAIKALQNPVKALEDLKTLNNFAIWHSSYMVGYHQYFAAIKSQVNLDIPNKDVSPNAF